MKKKSIGNLFGALLLIGLTLFLFCCSSGDSSKDSSPQPNILRIGTPNKVKSANIFLDSYLSIFAHLSNPPLMKPDKEGNPVGQLLSEIQSSPDNKTWTFILKDDLYWSDGKKVTPEDIKFSIEYTGDKNPVAGWIKETIDEISTDNNNSVILALSRPYNRLNIEFMTYKILPRHIWQNITEPMKYTNPGPEVGCGPFYIKQTDLYRGVIVFAKNPYWKGIEPKIDGVEIHLFQNMDILSLALENGTIDTYYKYASSYPYPNLRKLRSQDRFGFIEKPHSSVVFLGWDIRKKPLSDLQFREALSYAIDYEEIIKLDTLDYGLVPNKGFIPEGFRYYKETLSVEYDVSRARELLEKAGYADSDQNGFYEFPSGTDLTLELLTTSSSSQVSPSYTRIAELIRDYFNSAGIKLNIKTVDPATWVNFKDNYKYDLTLSRTSPWGMLMHAGWATGYFDVRRTGEGVLHTVDDPVFLALCDSILAAKDDKGMENLAHSVQDYYSRNLPAIPLFWNVIVTPYNNSFKGWKTDPLYGIFCIDNFLSIEKTIR